MTTLAFAMWLQQDSDAAGTHRLVFILVLLIAVAVAGMAIVLVSLALKASKVIKDLTVMADQFKGKLITEHLVKTSEQLSETSQIAKAAVQKLEVTVSDANFRAQRQVARVDGMVSAALTTTAEVVETINHGIRVPAQKIAVMANQAKIVAEGLLAKVKSMAAGMPSFGGRRDPYDR
jgi:hypothetical protein